jgi:hypothetical protein
MDELELADEEPDHPLKALLGLDQFFRVDLGIEWNLFEHLEPPYLM